MTTLKEVVALASTLWANPPWPAEVQVLWAASLSEEDPDDLSEAVQHFFATDAKGFRPTPGQIKALLDGDISADAEQAWRAFLRAVAHYAGKPTHETVDMPKFADPRCPEAVRAIGGFRQFLGGIESKEKEWLRSRFMKAYVSGARPQLKLLDENRNPELDGRGPTLLGDQGIG